MSDDLLGTVKAALDAGCPPPSLDDIRALVTRCEQADGKLAALRQRHAEAVRLLALTVHPKVAVDQWYPLVQAYLLDDSGLASDAHARLSDADPTK